MKTTYTCKGCGLEFESSYPTAWGKCSPCQIKHMEPGMQVVRDLILNNKEADEYAAKLAAIYNSPYSSIQVDQTVDHTKQCPNCLAPTVHVRAGGYTCTDPDCSLYWNKKAGIADGKVYFGTPISGGWNASPFDDIVIMASKLDSERIEYLEEALRSSRHYAFKNFLDKMELKRTLRRHQDLASRKTED